MTVVEILFNNKKLYVTKGKINREDIDKITEGYVVGVSGGEITSATNIDSAPYLVTVSDNGLELTKIPSTYAEEILKLSKKRTTPKTKKELLKERFS